MSGAAEGARAKQNIAAALAGGLETISLDQEITFTQYVRMVLPLDGFVFWVKADLLSRSAMLNALQFNAAQFNEAKVLTAMAPTLTVPGSFHYSTQVNQEESESEAVNNVIFTTTLPVQQFNDVQPNVMWIAEYGGNNGDGAITFAFNSRGRYYEQADLFHYAGIAVLPVFKPQLISSMNDLAAKGLFVSNSLSIWLQLSNYTPPYDNGISCSLPLYPSFLVPDNLPPPYGAVHIGENDTESMQPTPWFDKTLSQNQLAKDRVAVTLYGVNNEGAQSFLAAVMQFSYDYNTIGMMGLPVIRDAKRVASELGVIAPKKRIEFEVSYNQGTLRDIVRAQLAQVFVQVDTRFGPF